VWPRSKGGRLWTWSAHLDLPFRPPQPMDMLLPPLPGPESSLSEKPTILRRGNTCVEHIRRIGLELGTESKSFYYVQEDDPLSAVAELGRTQTMSREAWQIKIETRMRLSCTRNAFLLQASLRAWEIANVLMNREWDSSIPREFI